MLKYITPKKVIYALKNYGLKRSFVNGFSLLVSDYHLVSFQKSGRSWLRMMLINIFTTKYKMKKIDFDSEYMTLFSQLPNIVYSHAGCCTATHKHMDDFINLLERKKIILLVRDPRDDVVSLFHDHTKRNLLYDGDNISEFIRDETWGLKKIVYFLNLWAKEMKRRRDDFYLMKYEDMHKDTFRELKGLLNHLNMDVEDKYIHAAIKYGSFENMRNIELSGKINDRRMWPGNVNDVNSYRTRKGKVGSHKGEISAEDIEFVNDYLKKNLVKVFGYTT